MDNRPKMDKPPKTKQTTPKVTVMNEEEGLENNSSVFDDPDIIKGDTLNSAPYELTAIARAVGDKWAYGVVLRVDRGGKYPYAGTLDCADTLRPIDSSEKALSLANEMLPDLAKRLKAIQEQPQKSTLSGFMRMIQAIIKRLP